MQDRNIADSIVTYKTDIRHIIKVLNRSFLLFWISELKTISQHDYLVIKYMYNEVVNYDKYYIYSIKIEIAITVINELKKCLKNISKHFQNISPKKKRYSPYLIAPIYSTDFILSNIDLTKQKMTLFRIRLSLSFIGWFLDTLHTYSVFVKNLSCNNIVKSSIKVAIIYIALSLVSGLS